MMFLHRNSTKYYNNMIVMNKFAHLTPPKNESTVAPINRLAQNGNRTHKYISKNTGSEK